MEIWCQAPFPFRTAFGCQAPFRKADKKVSGTEFEVLKSSVRHCLGSTGKNGVRHRLGSTGKNGVRHRLEKPIKRCQAPKKVSGTVLVGEAKKGVRHCFKSAKNGVLRNRWTEGPR